MMIVDSIQNVVHEPSSGSAISIGAQLFVLLKLIRGCELLQAERRCKVAVHVSVREMAELVAQHPEKKRASGRCDRQVIWSRRMLAWKISDIGFGFKIRRE